MGMMRADLLKYHRTSRATKEPWLHGLAHGTDYNGGHPYSLASDITFHEQNLGIFVAGFRVSWEDEGWKNYVPAIFRIEYDAAIPKGCGYTISHDGENLTFIINADVSVEMTEVSSR